MRKEDKTNNIEQIAATVREYAHFYVADTMSMNAEKTSTLRRACFKNDIKLLCVKNTLFIKALESIEDVDFSELLPALKGSSAIMFSNTGNAPAKLIKSYKDKKEALPALKAAYVEGAFYVGADQLDALGIRKAYMCTYIHTYIHTPIRRNIMTTALFLCLLSILSAPLTI